MDAIITAGGLNKPDDPLYLHTGIEKKALIPLMGRPMICWVVDALVGAKLVDHLVIVGLTADEITPPPIPTHFLDAQDTVISNIKTARDKLVELNPASEWVLLASSDIPLITSQIVRGFVAECKAQPGGDAYYSIVEQHVMETRFPNSRRTFVPFRDGRYTGGDLMLLRASLQPNIKLMNTLTGARKNPLAQAKAIGFGFILRFLLRLMTTQEAATHAGKRANLGDARVVSTQFPELAMDLDKPHQYDIIKAILEAQVMPSAPSTD